jgi:hypothetical protein
MKTPRPVDELLKAFDERHDWWMQVTRRAEKNHALHQANAHQAAAHLNRVETAATGFQRIFDRLQKNGLQATQPDLATLYKKHAALEATILNPLQNLQMNGALSQRRPQFWHDYEEMLAQKDFTAAERHLKQATNWWQRMKITLAGGGHFAFREWENDIRGAQRHLKTYRNACDSIGKIEDTIEDAEGAVSDALYKILNDKKVQRAIPAMLDMTQQRPEFQFLAHYKGRTSVSRGEIQGYLSSMRGKFRLENLMRISAELTQRMPALVDNARQKAHESSVREQTAHQFLESVGATKRMELYTSRLVDYRNSDLYNELDNAVTNSSGNTERLAAAAEEKMKRWVKTGKVEANLDEMAKPDFDPKNLYATPWHGYVVNAGLHSLKRSVWHLPVKGMSALAAFTGAMLKQTWESISSSGQTAPPPPSPQQQPPQPQKPSSLTP